MDSVEWTEVSIWIDEKVLKLNSGGVVHCLEGT